MKLFLKKTSLEAKVQKVDEEQLGSQVDVQKIALQMKVEQVDDQLLNSKVDLQLKNLKQNQEENHYQSLGQKSQIIFITEGSKSIWTIAKFNNMQSKCWIKKIHESKGSSRSYKLLI